ncbi:hypothetical protein WHI96_26050 [Pseudonocardia tropica]|uniref:Uncharacterized protein n=1 Tax=Pseudonocardia tropica TaxID=681289 RepID=A0ABV1K210_9PSEU
MWPLARTGADLIYQFEMPFIVDGSAFTRRFGGRPTPDDDGVGETLAWYTAGRPSALALDPHGAADVPYPRDGNASRGRPSSGAVPSTATGR